VCCFLLVVCCFLHVCKNIIHNLGGKPSRNSKETQYGKTNIKMYFSSTVHAGKKYTAFAKAVSGVLVKYMAGCVQCCTGALPFK